MHPRSLALVLVGVAAPALAGAGFETVHTEYPTEPSYPAPSGPAEPSYPGSPETYPAPRDPAYPYPSDPYADPGVSEPIPTEPPPSPGGPPPAEAPGQPEFVLSEAEVVGVVHAANQALIVTGQQAQRKAGYPEVVDFGYRVAVDHSALDQQLLALAQQLGVPPAPSPLSGKIGTVLEHAQGHLEPLPAGKFEVAYTDGQLFLHAGFLNVLDWLIGTQPLRPDLRATLEAARSLVLSHLEEATRIRQVLVYP